MKIKIALLFLVLHSQLYAQKLVVQCTYTNMLYIGMENELVFSYEGVKSEDLLVRGTDNCILRHVKDATYMARPELGKPTCKIYIGLKKYNGKRWLDSIVFQVKLLGKPRVLFGQYESGSHYLNDLMEQDSIQVEMDGYAKNIQFRVTKYSMVIVPKTGAMSEFECTGSKISQQVKDAMAILKEGDIILIDRIRAIGPGGVRPLNPITISILGNNINYFYESKRVKGFYRDANGLKLYRYPILKNQLAANCELKKDSIWMYWDFNNELNKYSLFKIDSFSKGTLLVTTYFNDTSGRKMYQLRPSTDSTSLYESYYPNGSIYQKGLVRMDTRNMKFGKTMFYENKQWQSNKEAWHLCLNETPDYLFPIGEWRVYDTIQKIKMVVNYASIINSNLGCKDDPLYPWTLYYYIAPHGECLLYKNGKLSETILFKEGVMEKRKIER